jgi:hypothetical protein
MIDNGRYCLLSRPHLIGSARINRNGCDTDTPTAFPVGPEPSTTGLTPSLSESRDSERLDSSRCLARALASQVMATQSLPPCGISADIHPTSFSQPPPPPSQCETRPVGPIRIPCMSSRAGPDTGSSSSRSHRRPGPGRPGTQGSSPARPAAGGEKPAEAKTPAGL